MGNPQALTRAICLMLFGMLLNAGSALAAEVSLGVAANFTDTGRKLIERFEANTAHKVTASFGSTGKLFAQILNGAPYDVFMAADTRRPMLIEEAQVDVRDTRFTYARGKLVLWSPRPNLFANNSPEPIDYLTRRPFARLAIANPRTAPYGFAAQQVLEHLGQWQALRTKLVRGDSISQAFQFIATGNAQAGFVALAQVKAWSQHTGSVWQVPQGYYSPIDQQAILLSRGAGNTAAEAWMRFLKSDTAITIIRNDGYDTTD